MASPGRAFTRPGLSLPDKRTRKPNSVQGLNGPIAVIPLDAALPRTFISDLPGGFSTCSSRLGASGRCAAGAWLLAPASLPIWSCSVWGLPCLRHYCRSGALLPHLFTLTSAWGSNSVGFPVDCSKGLPHAVAAPCNGGIFSVALAVHGPLSPRPGRYPAHCPLEFGLSSPGSLRVPPKPPAATARSSCQWIVYRESGFTSCDRGSWSFLLQR